MPDHPITNDLFPINNELIDFINEEIQIRNLLQTIDGNSLETIQIKREEISTILQNIRDVVNSSQTESTNQTVANYDFQGQPIGLIPEKTVTQKDLMSQVLRGQDVTQLLSTELLRSTGGVAPTELLLGLNQPTSTIGIITPPPGNLNYLANFTPTMKRNILKKLLTSRFDDIESIIAVLNQENYEESDEEENNFETETEETLPKKNPAKNKQQYPRAFEELTAVLKMIELLNQIVELQDLVVSNMSSE